MSITVVPYDPAWPARFERERALLEAVLAPWLDGGLHHIGSTSVAGLAAKPVVDMMAGVRELDQARAATTVLEQYGYVLTPHRPDVAHHFDKRDGDVTTHGLHLTEPGSALWRERLAFRDALRRDAALAREYEALKLDLAARPDTGLGTYTRGKRAFVARVLAADGIELRPTGEPAQPAGWKSSTTFPEGSSRRICCPPGPVTISFRNATPSPRRRSTSAAMSSTSRWMRFHPPGPGTRPSGIGRPAELFGPLSRSLSAPRRTSANAGAALEIGSKPR